MKRKTKLFCVSIFCMMSLMLLQSCSVFQTTAELKASFDANRPKAKSESPTPIPILLVGENIGMVIMTGANPTPNQIPELNKADRRRSIYSEDWRSQNLLASNSNNYYYAPKAKQKQDIMNNILFSGGIELVTKRSKLEDIKYSFTYLELPFYALYQYEMKDGNIFGGLGPYFAYGIGGKVKVEGGESYAIFTDNAGFKRFDAGITFMAGYKMNKGFRFYLAYDDGIANIETNGNANERVRSKTISLNASYPFNKIFKEKKASKKN